MAKSERGGEVVAALGIDGGTWKGVVGGDEGKILRKVNSEMVNFRIRISLTLIPCKEIETLKEKDCFIHREKGDIYRRQGEHMGNNQ